MNPEWEWSVKGFNTHISIYANEGPYFNFITLTQWLTDFLHFTCENQYIYSYSIPFPNDIFLKVICFRIQNRTQITFREWERKKGFSQILWRCVLNSLNFHWILSQCQTGDQKFQILYIFFSLIWITLVKSAWSKMSQRTIYIFVLIWFSFFSIEKKKIC